MVSTGGWRAFAAALVLLAGPALSACGAEEEMPGGEPTGAETSSASEPDPAEASERASTPADAPACNKIWRDGATLPRIYPGCVAHGTYVKSDRLGCSSGQRMVRYDNRFYAVPGGTVREAKPTLAENREYRDALASCRG